MGTQKRQEIVKNLIEGGQITEFRDIFLYVTKTQVAKQLGIGYTRFIKLVKDPKPFRYREIYMLAAVLKVPARNISELIHNQIDKKKR